MIRGGSWNNSAENCRASSRNYNDPANSNNNIGLRVARSSAVMRKQERTEQADLPFRDADEIGRHAARRW